LDFFEKRMGSTDGEVGAGVEREILGGVLAL
jgi:hypothetical protein